MRKIDLAPTGSLHLAGAGQAGARSFFRVSHVCQRPKHLSHCLSFSPQAFSSELYGKWNSWT